MIQKRTYLRMVVTLALAAGSGWLMPDLKPARAADTTGSAHVSELTDQGWQDVTTRHVEAPAPMDPLLQRAETLLQKGQFSSVQHLLGSWFKTHPFGTPYRDHALWMMAEALYQHGDRMRSFYYLDELMDEYPGSSLFYQALQKQYDIADAYLRGYKRRFLLLPIISAEDEAVEMLYRIQQRSPGSPLAEKALLRTADYYYANSDYDLAADAYAAYVRNYARSPEVPRALLREAFSTFAQFRGLRYDATPLVNARLQLMDIMARYPDLAAQEGLASLVQRIDQTFAQKILMTADFYRRTGQPRGAEWNYEFLIKTYPNSAEAQVAKSRLAKLGEYARNEVQPQAGHGYVPTGLQADHDE